MDPNLADCFCFTAQKRLGIDNLDLGVESRLPATDERSCFVLLGVNFDDAMLLERIGADGASDRRFCPRHFQSRFRQAIRWMERFATKTTFAKLVCKAPQCLDAHWLRAVISYPPTPQIQSRALLAVHTTHAQVVSEVWTTRVRDLKARDGFQPAQWLLEKRDWRHEDARKPTIQRLD